MIFIKFPLGLLEVCRIYMLIENYNNFRMANFTGWFGMCPVAICIYFHFLNLSPICKIIKMKNRSNNKETHPIPSMIIQKNLLVDCVKLYHF